MYKLVIVVTGLLLVCSMASSVPQLYHSTSSDFTQFQHSAKSFRGIPIDELVRWDEMPAFRDKMPVFRGIAEALGQPQDSMLFVEGSLVHMRRSKE